MAIGTMEKPVLADQQAPAASVTAAKFLLKQLEAWGVKRMYGVIGDTTLYVLDELGKQDGTSIQYVACRHEEAAALMASAEAKLTGGLGVCCATSGPGIANLLNGLADASLDGAAVLAITGQVELAKLGTNAKQFIDQQRLADPIAAGMDSVLIGSADALPEVLLRLMAACLGQGKVAQLSVPKDVWLQQVKQGTVTPYMPHMHQPLLAPEDVVREAGKLLKQARKPLLYAGRGMKGLERELVQLAELLDAPVVTTMPSKQVFPNGHRLYAGGLGQGGSEVSSRLMDDSDLIVMLGASWWPESYTPKQADIVQIDIVRETIGVGHPLKLGVVGDLRQVVPKLIELGTGGEKRREWRSHAEGLIEGWRQQLSRECSQEERGARLAPQQLMKVVSDVCAENAVIAVDTGDHTLWFGRSFEAKAHAILLSGMWRTLGFALPAAIAAKLAAPERQSLAIAGDGGAIQTLLELKTAAQYGAGIVMLVLNNGSYAMEKNRMEAAGLNTLGSLLDNPDFCAVAEACGASARRVTNAAELEQALREALAAGKPALIEAIVADTPVPHTSL